MTFAKRLARMPDRMLNAMFRRHPNQQQAMRRLAEDLNRPTLAEQMRTAHEEEAREEHAAFIAGKAVPGDDCPTQRVIDTQARYAIKEWDGGL
jgi:hypothetical protein